MSYEIIFASQIKNVQIDFWETVLEIKFITQPLLKFGFETRGEQRRSEESVF